MKLSEVAAFVPTTEVPLSFSTEERPVILTVRGLNMTDLMMVVHDMGPVVASAFEDAVKMSQGGQLTHDRMKSLLLDLPRKSPELIARIIAAATDDGTPEADQDGTVLGPDARMAVLVRAAAKLPAADQMALLIAVGQESLRSEAQLKKLGAFLVDKGPLLLGTLARAGSNNTGSVAAARTAPTSRRGTGASARR